MPSATRVLTAAAGLAAATVAAATVINALRHPAWETRQPWLLATDDDLYELFGDPETAWNATAAQQADTHDAATAATTEASEVPAAAQPNRCGAPKPGGGTCQRRVTTGRCKSHPA